jgi:hypothetical protein
MAKVRMSSKPTSDQVKSSEAVNTGRGRGWISLGVESLRRPHSTATQCCSSSHIAIWQYMLEYSNLDLVGDETESAPAYA